MHLKNYSIHFVGIGGVGMSGLAELLHNLGAKVTGSDIATGANVSRLQELGVNCFLGHSAENIGEIDVLVYTSAVDKSNPEIKKALDLKVPVIPRAEILGEIMSLQRGIAVGGTHGKTTTTSIIGNMLIHVGKEPTIVVGGRLDLIKSTARLGSGQWLVAEADESDGSFLKLNPEISIITNIDYDHMDHYGTEENLLNTFLEFANKVPFYGRLIAFGDDPLIRKALTNYNKRILFYGFGDDNDIRIEGSNSKYNFYQSGDLLGEFECALPGAHNALNSTAALIVGLELGLSFAVASEGIKVFQGVGRRMEYKGLDKGMERFDDYAHHPTEIKATILGLREKFPESKIAVVFQPHRYSRTQLCWEDFKTSFTGIDQLFIADIYAASEQPIAGIDSKKLAEEIDLNKTAYLQTSLDLSIEKSKLDGIDVLVTMGAGDIYNLEITS
ncbi:MAG: UDP-N-acetylmuramate--L-alanine ligase [Bdellovibrionales bacterium]